MPPPSPSPKPKSSPHPSPRPTQPASAELPDGQQAALLHIDRSVVALDKPAGWVVAPEDFPPRDRNLQRFLRSELLRKPHWVRAHQIRFLRFVHRLDAETTGILLLVRNPGAMAAYSRLFAAGHIEKTYLAVVEGTPSRPSWTATGPIGPVPGQPARQHIDRHGKPAETRFQVLESRGGRSLVEARPLTGRTHQIRVHLQAGGHPVCGDVLYGTSRGRMPFPLGLRAVRLAYRDPFTRRAVEILAPRGDFLRFFGFDVPADETARPSSIPTGVPPPSGAGTGRTS